MIPKLRLGTIFGIAIYNNDGKASGRRNYYRIERFIQGDDSKSHSKSVYRSLRCHKDGTRMLTKSEIPFVADSLEMSLLENKKETNYALIRR